MCGIGGLLIAGFALWSFAQQSAAQRAAEFDVAQHVVTEQLAREGVVAAPADFIGNGLVSIAGALAVEVARNPLATDEEVAERARHAVWRVLGDTWEPICSVAFVRYLRATNRRPSDWPAFMRRALDGSLELSRWCDGQALRGKRMRTALKRLSTGTSPADVLADLKRRAAKTPREQPARSDG